MLSFYLMNGILIKGTNGSLKIPPSIKETMVLGKQWFKGNNGSRETMVLGNQWFLNSA